jgi:hypothetical protein
VEERESLCVKREKKITIEATAAYSTLQTPFHPILPISPPPPNQSHIPPLLPLTSLPSYPLTPSPPLPFPPFPTFQPSPPNVFSSLVCTKSPTLTMRNEQNVTRGKGNQRAREGKDEGTGGGGEWSGVRRGGWVDEEFPRWRCKNK